MRSIALWILLIAVLAGCAAEQKPRPLTERERHEAIAESVLPGATVVGRALSVSDSAAARSQRLENQADPNESTP